MKRYCCLLLILWLFSCGKEKQIDLKEIPVDFNQNSPVLLSEIAEEITAIELELTDESIINPDRIKRIVISEDYIFVGGIDKIFVFNKEGKFVRSIGSKGQGPGEYRTIRNFDIDEKNERLFVNAWHKIICYDLQGILLKETLLIPETEFIVDVSYINDELLIIGYQSGREDANGLFNHSAIYHLNDEFQIIDSCTIMKIYERFGFSTSGTEEYILWADSTVYFYYPYFYPSPAYFPNHLPPLSKAILRDTMYRFENNQLVPELKLKLKNDGMDGSGNLFIDLQSVFRSSRYIFAKYMNYTKRDHPLYYFCYDTKTKKGSNMQDGYTDDVNGIDKPVRFLPLNSNPEMFYYWHTNMKPDDFEEPNPTLYIGKLKK